MKNPITTLAESHSELLKMARLQIKKYPSTTCRGLEDAVANAEQVSVADISELLDQAIEWKTAAILLARSLQNPNDTEAAWRAVIAFVKVNAQVWEFASESSPSKSYQTLQYIGGSTSCNCPGWTRNISANGSRSCRHTRYVDMGSATQHATAHSNYATSVNVNVQVAVNHHTAPAKSGVQFGVSKRKIIK